ncbi:hypothetical protein AKJ16_DCAP06997 [Drosera capensis]
MIGIEAMQRRFESWIKDQTSKIPTMTQLPTLQWPKVKVPSMIQWKWPPRKIQEEYERRKKQINELCGVVKADSVADLQDILCCMVLSECVYKKPASELIRAVNKFKGVGPVQTSFWRLSRLVPLDASTGANPVTTLVDDDVPESLEFQEGSDGASLKRLPGSDKKSSEADAIAKFFGKRNGNSEDNVAWHGVPYLPSFVPFGQLYLLGTSYVELLSDAEYSKLTSQFPHLQQWFGLSFADAMELGHIFESPSIRTATSIAPLGWSGSPGDKNAEPLKVDITGCTITLESFPSAPKHSSEVQPEIQKMRVVVGAPLKTPPTHQLGADSLIAMFPSVDSESINLKELVGTAFPDSKFIRPGGLNNFVLYCTSDFTTVSKEVDIRTRRVRLVGLEVCFSFLE